MKKPVTYKIIEVLDTLVLLKWTSNFINSISFTLFLLTTSILITLFSVYKFKRIKIQTNIPSSILVYIQET